MRAERPSLALEGCHPPLTWGESGAVPPGHVNLLGRYHFTVPGAVLRGELRPLRDPNDPDEILNAGAAIA